MKRSEQIHELAAALAKAQGDSDAFAESTLIRSVTRIIRPIKVQAGSTIYSYFWNRVSFGSSECWYWRASIGACGYGTATHRSIKMNTKAHRLSWCLFNGKIPIKKMVLHRCDIRNCVNPDHLFLGNQKDNMSDCSAKGRINPTPQPGEKNPMAKLTAEKVIEMRKFREIHGLHYKELAKMFGVSTMTALRACKKISWGNV